MKNKLIIFFGALQMMNGLILAQVNARPLNDFIKWLIVAITLPEM